MKIIPYIILLFLMSSACYSIEKKYYEQDLIDKIKQIKKDNRYTYLDQELPKPEKEKILEYQKRNLHYKFNEKEFKNRETIFAISGRSTENNGVLYLKQINELIPIDSSHCNYGDFILLKLKPVKKGEYKIKSWGCRWGKEFIITIY